VRLSPKIVVLATMIMLALPAGTAPPAVDVRAPVSIWTVVTFILTWSVTVLGFRLQLRKSKRDAEEAALETRKQFAEDVLSVIRSYLTSEDYVLKWERRVGNLCEKITSEKVSVERRSMVTMEALTDKIIILQKEMENARLQMKNDLLKEVIILLNTKVVGIVKGSQ
jgi:hypothetical protein